MANNAKGPVSRERLVAARMRLCGRYPFLSLVAYSCRFVQTKGLKGKGYLAVDKDWRIYYDPAVETSDDELVWCLWHEIAGHVLGAHAQRGEGREWRRWLVATDCAINCRVPSALPTPPGVLHPSHFQLPPDLIAEDYYEQLQLPPDSAPTTCAGGSGAGEPQPSWEQAPEDPVKREEQQADVRRQAAVRITQEQPGSVPGGLYEWAIEYLYGHPVDYGHRLAARVRRALAWRMGAVDYVFTRPSRRQCLAPGGILIPALRRPIPHVAIVLDTSGSMDVGKFNRAAGEVRQVAESVGVPCWLLGTDVAVHAVVKLQPGMAVPEMRRGGGTRMQTGVDYAVTVLRPAAEEIVVITDAETPWGDRPPVPVVVGVVENPTKGIPEWCERVDL